MVKKKTSVVIDDQLWKEFKKHAIDQDKDLSDILEEMIEERLGRTRSH